MTDREIPTIDSHQGELRCPLCGEYNLHQGTVEVFNRHLEDGPINAVLVPRETGAPIGGGPERNPSGRRQGLLISFMCETCGETDYNRLTLEIYQHKGTTYLRWRGV